MLNNYRLRHTFTRNSDESILDSVGRFRWSLVLFCLLSPIGCGCSADSKPGLLSSFGYHIGKTKVWYKNHENGLEVYSVHQVIGADAPTFREKTFTNKQGTSQTLGVDAQHVFWGWELIEGADLATFEYVGSGYFKDKNYAYSFANRLSEDAANFELIGDFVRDSKNVYFASSVFSDDAPNFQRVGPIESKYYRDSKRCWYFISPIAEADPNTIRSLGGNYAADQEHIFYEMNLLEGADQATFQILPLEYSRDAIHVYYQSLPLEDAQADSFKVLNFRYSVDASRCYYYGFPIKDAAPLSFQVIDEYYTKDASHVWINGTLIDGADPATFRVIQGPGGKSRDANYEYDMEQRVGGK